ncbi:hypothetical protein BDY19DRAFT_504282 [Irpex rosettiformis]|uniref:Uncharacterized protein n=1 Tax=Irpex rosettiformis TaxID=378272 RepID=A0ACB8UEU1_9APHY|nr:hypothetical protein BDY19DRAFT_504282 [Irpex rosettiformis]
MYKNIHSTDTRKDTLRHHPSISHLVYTGDVLHPLQRNPRCSPLRCRCCIHSNRLIYEMIVTGSQCVTMKWIHDPMGQWADDGIFSTLESTGGFVTSLRLDKREMQHLLGSISGVHPICALRIPSPPSASAVSPDPQTPHASRTVVSIMALSESLAA